MKKFCLALITCATLGSSFNTLADDNHTVSLGYANSKIQEMYNLKGVNLKYRYEWDSPVSVITSFTYMGGSEKEAGSDYGYWVNDSNKSRYLSLSAGPAYRFNEFISFYGLVGVNVHKVINEETRTSRSNRSEIESERSTYKHAGVMYGAGIQINPLENIAIDIGYEGSTLGGNDCHYSINGFNVGVGYRF